MMPLARLRSAIALKPASLLLICAMLSFGFVRPAASHQMEPAVVTALVESDQVTLTIRDAFEPIIAISEVEPKSDADGERVNSRYRELRVMAPAELEEVMRAQWPAVAKNLDIYAGDTRLEMTLTDVTSAEVGDPQTLRFGTFTMTAKLPADDSGLRFAWRADFGPVSIHQSGGNDDGYTELLQGGQTSQPMLRNATAKEPTATLFARFVTSGFEHIVPKGADHILFVLGLFLFSRRVRPILAQVTAFTLAHSVTLALASLKIVSLPASIVEPLIAISIVYVAVENIAFAKDGRVSWARVAVVFGFGLLHGMGFASVLSDVGLPAGQFVTGLVGFNVGVELAQLFVILVASLLLGLPFGRKPWYRKVVVIPGSAVIALVGAWWAIERILG
jgi:hypothetical protein